jgi:RHS repeat-associated protein
VLPFRGRHSTSLPSEMRSVQIGTSPTHFTGKERDTESGNDYFGARYYISTMGRFMSPDWADKPEAAPYTVLGNPQILNLYAYVGNNPISGYDRDGPLVNTPGSRGGLDFILGIPSRR